MTYAYYSAKAKVAILRLVGYILHPWINDLAVRVYQHYPQPIEFFYVYRKAMVARIAGQSHITISDKPGQPPPPPQTSAPQKKIIPIANYLHRRRKKK